MKALELLRWKARRRGRRLAVEPGRRMRLWCAGLAGLLVALFGLDQIFAPPLERARVVSPVVTDQDGVWLSAFLTPTSKWRLAANLDETDPEFIRRLLAIEDNRFYWHPGVDPAALVRAAGGLLRNGQASSGASTITMQLARLLEPRPRTLASKWIEMVRALQIERRLSKREILAAYLTMTPYGGNLEGVRAASRGYFQRDPKGLSDAEIALLIALPQAPEGRRPDRHPLIAKAARDGVLRKLARAGFLDARALHEAISAPIIGRAPFPARAALAARAIALAHPRAASLRSTLDARLQASLEALVRRHAQSLGGEVTAALLAVEIDGRAVRACVSGAGADRPGGWIDMTKAVRSPGSALKPFIYGIAFDDGNVAPETLVEDAPRRFDGYLPENFDRHYHGDVRLEDALRQSLNLPAVAVLEQIGAQRFAAALAAAGAAPRLPAQGEREAGLALALGGAGLTLEELVTLYAALGDGGMARPLVRLEGERGRFARRLLSPDSAQKILTILAAAPAPQGRAPSLIAADAPRIAYKTGTSYGFRDAWALGVAGGWVVGVWVGRADAAPRPGATGRRDAAPLLYDAFDLIAPKGGFAPSPSGWRGLAAPGLARLDEAGTTGPTILFPPDASAVRVEQLGPTGRGLALAARGGEGGLTWFAEGKQLTPEAGSGRVVWHPASTGFHTVSVIDAAGRGAKVRVQVLAAR